MVFSLSQAPFSSLSFPLSLPSSCLLSFFWFTLLLNAFFSNPSFAHHILLSHIFHFFLFFLLVLSLPRPHFPFPFPPPAVSSRDPLSPADAWLSYLISSSLRAKIHYSPRLKSSIMQLKEYGTALGWGGVEGGAGRRIIIIFTVLCVIYHGFILRQVQWGLEILGLIS